jgi:outer membrane protein insertion porin family
VLLGNAVSLAQIRLGNTGLGNTSLRQQQSDDINYLQPKEYTIGDVVVTGTEFLEKDVLITISKLNVGSRITVPGEETANAIKNLWAQGLFDDVALKVASIQNETIYLEIAVVERPRLTRIEINGLSKTQTEDIQKKLSENSGKILNENLYNTTRGTIERYLAGKGYLYPDVTMKAVADSILVNNQILVVDVDRNKKVKIRDINFSGNEEFSDKRLRKFLKKIKPRVWWNIFPGKFSEEKYQEAKSNLVAKMHDLGFRDAAVVSDTVIKVSDKRVDVEIEVLEGAKYYFGNISWSGNAKYSDTVLNTILGIKKGDVFSEEKLNRNLSGSPSSNDVSSLYLNDGYLTFQIDPVQTKVYNDTIDLELRMYEGPQYTISDVSVQGNDVTNDRVILREIATKPGQKFSKEQVMRTIREIAQLGNFDETKTDIVPIPNPNDGTVDLVYTVVEKPSDQIELSGGFGGQRIIGTLGLTFNNFSTKNFWDKKAWRPLPRGDGQKLSLRGQASGSEYQSYSFSFSEPWFGGKKPVYFGISAYTSGQTYGGRNWITGRRNDVADEDLQKIRMNGITVSLGKRLQWPDNWFRVNYSANFQQYKLQNWDNFLFRSGTSYNINLTQEISRNSVDAPIYPTSGAHLRFTLQLTPPYSLLNNINYLTAADKDRYRWTEYHKWKFDSQWYQRIAGKLVLKAQAQFGFLGSYSSVTGQPAFERFKLGGDGMQGYEFLQGSEIIAMRGYANGYVVPEGVKNINVAIQSGSPIYTKYQLELRHPIMLNDQATVFGLAFAEAGNTWNNFQDFNPFKVKRALGIGARVYLPIFGMLGIDYGYGFDPIPGVQGDAWRQNFTFSISQQLGGF